MIRQLDIRNAFLHGSLKETIYIEQPPDFRDPVHPTYVCKLHKSLFSLKHAPRAWFECLSQVLIEIGFKSSKAGSSLFTFHKNSVIILILIYIDDVIVTRNHEGIIFEIINSLMSRDERFRARAALLHPILRE